MVKGADGCPRPSQSVRHRSATPRFLPSRVKTDKHHQPNPNTTPTTIHPKATAASPSFLSRKPAGLACGGLPPGPLILSQSRSHRGQRIPSQELSLIHISEPTRR